MKLQAVLLLSAILATVIALPSPGPAPAATCDANKRQTCIRKSCAAAACCGLEAGANFRALVLPFLSYCSCVRSYHLTSSFLPFLSFQLCHPLRRGGRLPRLNPSQHPSSYPAEGPNRGFYQGMPAHQIYTALNLTPQIPYYLIKE